MTGNPKESGRREGGELKDCLKIVSSLPFSEVERRLRCAPLKGIPEGKYPGNYYPNRRASICLAQVKVNELLPCAKYVLRSGIEMVQNLKEAFLKEGLDILNLPEEKSLIQYEWEGSRDAVISPPVVEVSVDDGNKKIIVDGLHRIFVARQAGEEKVTVSLVEGAAVPITAFPVGWSKVVLCDEVPPNVQKRNYRFSIEEQAKEWFTIHYSRFVRGFEAPELDFDTIDSNHWSYAPGVAILRIKDKRTLLVKDDPQERWRLPGCRRKKSKSLFSVGWGGEQTMRGELLRDTGLVALRYSLTDKLMVVNNRIGEVYEVDAGQVDFINLERYVELYNEKAKRDGIERRLGLFTSEQLDVLAKSEELAEIEIFERIG